MGSTAVSDPRFEQWSRRILTTLEESGRARVAPGLTPLELARIERLVGAEVPVDLRVLLQTGLPLGRGYPDWRDGSDTELTTLIENPVEGIMFDILVNRYWPDWWQERPDDDIEAEAAARHLLDSVPRLIPLRGNMYLTADTKEAGNPVFSCNQADILVFGADLFDFWRRFLALDPDGWPTPIEPRVVPFWSRIASF